MDGEIITEEEVRRRLPERVKLELIRGFRARREFAKHAQVRVSRVLAQMPPQRHMNGLGARKTTIDRDEAAILRAAHGRACFHDPAFVAWLLRTDPKFRNGSVAQKTSVRVDGLRDNSRRTEPEHKRVAEGHVAQRDAAKPRDLSGHETAGGGSLVLP